VESIFQLGGEEQTSVWNLVTQVRDRLRHRFDAPPDGFNVGPNDGVQAGQTVLHSHVHVIPPFSRSRIGKDPQAHRGEKAPAFSRLEAQAASDINARQLKRC
jgi:diadenosine tetraphosphate (Ap4A) HIT family hydrolase